MDELIDLVDKTGKIIQAAVKRDDLAHHPDLHMQIVILVLLRDEQVLVHARSRSKKVNPGDVDHVCGGISSGESPLEAAIREAYEETGVKPTNLHIVTAGVNEYNRYRYLLVGTPQGEPSVQEPGEVEWTDYITLPELYAKRENGELTFVDGFFDDLALAIAYKTSPDYAAV